MFAKIHRIHFVGIGGVGMSGIAEVLLTLGYQVSGSDLRSSGITQRLQSLGATVFEGHRAENIAGAEVVVTSSAIQRGNPEIAEARARHIPVIQRAEMLAELMRLKYGIAIAGMHGKTTTTSMVGAVLQAGGLDPTIIVGGRVDALGTNARHGKSRYLVAEADESDRSFLKLSPIISVVTNIDREHLDTYRDLDDIEQTFLDFMDRVPFYGTVVLCLDDDRLRDLLPNIQRRVVTYGTHPDADFRIADIKTSIPNGGPASCFRAYLRGQELGEFHLHVPGVHNVLNAGAAIAVGIGLDIPPETIVEALRTFGGVERRFQLRGRASGINVVDDYGHHPTEIKATLAAARQCGFAHTHVIFQPHRYTRTAALLGEFGDAFAEADNVFVLDIYAASESPIDGINGKLVAKTIGDHNRCPVSYVSSFAEAAEAAAAVAGPGDLVLTLGAGNVSQLGPMVLSLLEARTQVAGASV